MDCIDPFSPESNVRDAAYYKSVIRRYSRLLLWSRFKLVIFAPVFALGLIADYRLSLLDRCSEARYGLEEFRGCLATLEATGSPYRMLMLSSDDQFRAESSSRPRSAT